jgi:signal transduction histidine kinase
MTIIGTSAPVARGGLARMPEAARADDRPTTDASRGSDGVMHGPFRAARERAWALLDPPERESGPGHLRTLFAQVASFARTHIQVTDGVIASAAFVFCLLADEYGDRSIARGVFSFLLALPLVWRRRAPITVFLFIAAIAFAQWLANLQLAGDVTLLLALFTVADDRPHRAAIGAAVILESGAVLATLRWSTSNTALRTFAFLSGVVVAALVSGIYFRARRAHVASLVERAERLELERDQQARLAAAAERSRIAREMHDVIAHSLAVVIALVDGASAKLRRDPDQAREALKTVSDLGRQALDDTRRLLSVLRTEDGGADRTPQPGIEEIAHLIDQVASTGIAATLTVEGEAISLAPGPALTAYRIVQEAITNVVKHAHGASAIGVTLSWSPRELEILVIDDGRHVPIRTPNDGGFGLTGMRERASLYGGTVAAGPGLDEGWIVHAALPTAERGAP